MPADFFGQTIYGVGEPAFMLDLRLQVIAVTITEVSATQTKRRGLDEPDINVSYLVEPREILVEPMRLHGRVEAYLVFETKEAATASRESIWRDRYGAAVTASTPGVMVTTKVP